jgi:hypothetical protein
MTNKPNQERDELFTVAVENTAEATQANGKHEKADYDALIEEIKRDPG